MTLLPSPDPCRCVVLCRVSSAEQADHGYGLDAQARACHRFAQAHGLEVVAEYREDARSVVPIDERPKGKAALEAMLVNGAGVLLLARRDRLARDPYIAGHAKRAVALAGGRILYAEGGNGDDDSALLLDDIQHALAAHERRAIVARLKAGRDAKAARYPGSRPQGGRMPFGYRRGRDGIQIEIDPEQATEVQRMYALARAGKSIRQIAAEVGRQPTAVERILRREDYKRGQTKIIDPRLWNATQVALASRRKRPAAR